MNTTIHTLDLNFLNTKESIGAFLIPTQKGLVLIESGPETTYHHLIHQIKQLGYNPQDISAVLLTHIHFDHAGAAWKFAQQGAKIYVHPIGLPHLADPKKLWNSAQMIYGKDMQRLWGNMQGINPQQLIPAQDEDIIDFGNVQFQVLYTPGHAVHHNAYKLQDVIFTGDVAGCKIDNGPVVPPCPPPDINIDLWKKSIQKIKQAQPSALYLTHFAKQENPIQLLQELEKELDNWANFIKPYLNQEIPIDQITQDFVHYTTTAFKQKGLTDAQIQVYEYANPSWMSVSGLLRYWKLKQQARL